MINSGWVNFYHETAHRLLSYKNNRTDLIQIIKNIFIQSELSLPTLEKENHLTDIDPFTVFGLFNKHQTVANRIKIITGFASQLQISSSIPSSFDGIPVLNNKNATFYRFENERGEHDMDDLWLLFENALKYSETPTEVYKIAFIKYFDIAVNQKGNGTSKITMGLYWIAPETFLNLDQRSEWYIYDSGKLPASFVATLPAKENKVSAIHYQEITTKIKDFLKSNESPIKSMQELSYESLRYSEQVNQARKVKKSEENNEPDLFPKTPNQNTAWKIEDQESANQSYPAYTEEDFQRDVFLPDFLTLKNLLLHKKNIILKGAPGVGKTYIAQRLAYAMIGEKNPDRVKVIQFHQNYSYEDFIIGFRPGKKGFELRHGVFYDFCKKAKDDSENDYFFIIDEINRGNISKIFGELFMLIENDKRGEELQLLYSNELFSIPPNLYLIGMMNTADRSLAMIDYALRRRFSFFTVHPGFESDGFAEYQASVNSPLFDRLVECIQNLNGEIANSLNSGFCIGHSYLCGINPSEDIAGRLKAIVDYDILPLCEEYWFDEPEKVQKWKTNLQGIFHDER